MRAFVRLTDFWSDQNEYLSVDEIVHIEPHDGEIEIEQDCEYTVGLFFKETIQDTEIVTEEHIGSRIQLADGQQTYVFENPDEVYDAIVAASRLAEQDEPLPSAVEEPAQEEGNDARN